MKKILLAAAVAGLVAVPTLASARHGADDNASTATNNVRREDRQADRQNEVNDDRVTGVDDSTSTANDDAEDTQSSATPTQTPTSVGGVKVETEATLPEGAVSLSAAQATAQAKFPTKTITKVEIENEHGNVVYSFRFSDGSRVDVDAASGDVVRSENRANNQSNHENESDDDDHSGRSNSGRDHAEDN